MKLQRTLIVLALVVVAGCGTKEPKLVMSGIAPGMEEGLRRNAGHGFYTIDVRTENPPGHWEAYHWGRDLYFNGTKIDEADPPDVSPSGRYAVYESTIHGGIVLFDSSTRTKLRVLEDGTSPTVKRWDPFETSFRLSYYITGNESTNVTIEIKALKPIEDEAEQATGREP